MHHGFLSCGHGGVDVSREFTLQSLGCLGRLVSEFGATWTPPPPRLTTKKFNSKFLRVQASFWEPGPGSPCLAFLEPEPTEGPQQKPTKQAASLRPGPYLAGCRILCKACCRASGPAQMRATRRKIEEQSQRGFLLKGGVPYRGPFCEDSLAF